MHGALNYAIDEIFVRGDTDTERGISPVQELESQPLKDSHMAGNIYGYFQNCEWFSNLIS